MGKKPPGDSLTKKASLNALASAIDYGTRLVVGFVVNPLLVAGLGDYFYGVWQFLGQLIEYVSPASGRPTQALKWTLASQQASIDYENKRRQVGNAVAVWLLFLPLLGLLGGLLTWFAPVWLKASTEFYSTIRLAATLLVVNLITISLVEVPRSVLEGENLGYKRMGLSAALVIVGGGLMVLALHLNTGLVGVNAARLITTLLTGLLFVQVVRTFVPWFGIAKPSFKAVRGFLGLSSWFLAWNLVMKLMLASDVVILGIFGKAELVTIYTLTKYVPETIISFVAIVVFGIAPGLGGVIGSGDFRKVARVRGEMMTFTWLVATGVGSTVLVWNPSFLRLWVGPEYDAGVIPTLLIVLMVMQFVLIRNDANIIDLTLNLGRKVLIGLLSASLSIVLAAVLVSFFKAGIIGLCFGLLVGRSILSVSYPLMIGRYLNLAFSYQLKSLLRPALVTGLLFGFAALLQGFLVVDSWYGLVFGSGVTLVVVSLLVFYIGLSAVQRQHILSRIQQLMGTSNS